MTPQRVQETLVVLLLLSSFVGGCDHPQDPQKSDGPNSDATLDISQNARLALLSKESPPRFPQARPEDIPRIVAFGNSLTAGLGVSSDRSYPSQLQERLDQAGYRYKVINAGVSGETTAGGLRRLGWVLKSNPKVVILELGANDGLRGHPLKETYSNLEQIIQKLQTAGVTVVLAGMKIPPNYGLPYTRRFAAMYEKLAAQYQTPLLPFFLEGVATRRELNQADGLHPTGEGYTVVVDNLMPILEPVLLAHAES